MLHGVSFFYYSPQRSWGKVIFSEACVKNSVKGGACMAGGMRGRGHAWQGACMVGMCGMGVGACVAGTYAPGRYYEIRSMSGGTHPTRMHSC